MKIVNKLKVYKDGGASIGTSISLEELIVENSSFSKKFVVLKFSGGEFSVKTDELKAAIDNATNNGYYYG